MAATKESRMELTTIPETIEWPETHYVFIEKKGPFSLNAPQAWTELHKVIPAIEKHNTVTRYFSLYKPAEQIYRAGVSVAERPKDLPAGVAYEIFQGGRYGRFLMTGSYANLPEACGRVFGIVQESKLPLREDYNIEHYVSDPRKTPEDELITELLFPMA